MLPLLNVLWRPANSTVATRQSLSHISSLNWLVILCWLWLAWGDWVKVTVNNHLQDNGYVYIIWLDSLLTIWRTSIYWHGIRQKGTNEQDGVNGLTECPLAPGGEDLLMASNRIRNIMVERPFLEAIYRRRDWTNRDLWACKCRIWYRYGTDYCFWDVRLIGTITGGLANTSKLL